MGPHAAKDSLFWLKALFPIPSRWAGGQDTKARNRQPGRVAAFGRLKSGVGTQDLEQGEWDGLGQGGWDSVTGGFQE